MRSLGQFAREEELQEMLKEVDINGKPGIILFCRIFVMKVKLLM